MYKLIKSAAVVIVVICVFCLCSFGSGRTEKIYFDEEKVKYSGVD